MNALYMPNFWKWVRLVAFIIALNVPQSVLFCQEEGQPDDVLQIQFYGGYEPFALDDAFFTIETGGDIDYSPVGTRVVIDQKSREYVNTVGLRLGVQIRNDFSFLRHNAYLDITTNSFTGPFYMVKAAVQYEPEYYREQSFIAGFIGISLGLTHMWEEIGAVGDGNDNDKYFDAADSTMFYKGSIISMYSDWLFKGALYGGIRVYINDVSNIFVLGGYEFGKVADRWNFHIVDASDSEITYSFPDTPFPRSPSSVTQKGTFLRAGFSLGIVER